MVEQGQDQALLAQLRAQLEPSARLIVLELVFAASSNWRAVTERVLTELKNLRVRQATFIGLRDAAVIAQNVALQSLRSVRKLIRLDPPTSPHPSLRERMVSWLESKLPLGLPLRLGNSHFDSRSLLHRMRCPVLAVMSATGTDYHRVQAEQLVAGLPTVWFVELEPQQVVTGFAPLVMEFEKVQAKCPQKNRRVARYAS